MSLVSSNRIFKDMLDDTKTPFGYFYRITDTITGKYYVGIRYKKGIDFSNDLGVKYFSSSKKLQRLIKNTNINRFVFEIRKIFYFNDINFLHYTSENDIISMESLIKNRLVSYEEKALRRLKAGSNAKLFNLVSSYKDVLLMRTTRYKTDGGNIG